MPNIGEICRAREIGKKASNGSYKYIWHACVGCRKERWVEFKNNKPASIRCSSCGHKGLQSGAKHHNWKGGRRLSLGYIEVWLSPMDFFHPMTVGKTSYVKEHRLVMAKHLKRCLLPWEVVHHKNGIKDDNRLENLQLLPTAKYHLVDTANRRLIANLQKQNKKLKERVKELLILQ